MEYLVRVYEGLNTLYHIFQTLLLVLYSKLFLSSHLVLKRSFRYNDFYLGRISVSTDINIK